MQLHLPRSPQELSGRSQRICHSGERSAARRSRVSTRLKARSRFCPSSRSARSRSTPTLLGSSSGRLIPRRAQSVLRSRATMSRHGTLSRFRALGRRMARTARVAGVRPSIRTRLIPSSATSQMLWASRRRTGPPTLRATQSAPTAATSKFPRSGTNRISSSSSTPSIRSSTSGSTASMLVSRRTQGIRQSSMSRSSLDQAKTLSRSKSTAIRTHRISKTRTCSVFLASPARPGFLQGRRRASGILR